MTKEYQRLAYIHKEAFLVGANDPPAQGEYLLQVLSESEFMVGGNALMADSDAAPILREALREVHPRNYAKLLATGQLDATLARHINNARSAAKFGAFGYFND